jgi:hypothetical protein
MRTTAATVLFVLATLPASTGNAACVFDGRSHWEIGEYLYFEQSNRIHVQITAYRDPKNPGHFSGQAFYRVGGQNIVGAVAGWALRDNIQFNIFWQTRNRGMYTGRIGDNGIAHGDTYDMNHPSSRATWLATLQMRCVAGTLG